MDAECDVAEQLRQQEIKCHGKLVNVMKKVHILNQTR